jgi:hypothetical protein
MEHPLESELKQFIVTKKASQLGDFTNEYTSHPKVSEIQVIGCKLLGLDPAPFNHFFKRSRDYSLIEELIIQYGLYPELAKLFIPETVVSVSVYKKLQMREQATQLIDKLIEKDVPTYCEEINNLKDNLFDGAIGITIKKFNPTLSDPFSWINEKILNKEAAPSSDTESLTRFNDFYFYKLNLFSTLNKEQEDEFFRIIGASTKPKKFKTRTDSKLIPLFLIGHVRNDGVQFDVHLSSVKNLYQGLPSTSIALPSDFSSFLKGVVQEGTSSQISDKIKDYIVSYLPGVKEAKLFVDIGEAVFKNTFKSNPDSLISLMKVHYDQIIKLNITIEDYYINHYLVGEFQKFFNQKDFPLSAEQFRPVFQTLYEYYIQNIKGFLSGDYEKEVSILIAASPEKHADTIRFKCVYSALNDSDSHIKRRLFERKQYS